MSFAWSGLLLASPFQAAPPSLLKPSTSSPYSLDTSHDLLALPALLQLGHGGSGLVGQGADRSRHLVPGRGQQQQR